MADQNTEIELDFDSSLPRQVDPVPVLAQGAYKGKKFFTLLFFPRDDMISANSDGVVEMVKEVLDEEIARHDLDVHPV